MPLQAIASSEPIAGYKIVERIGAGGYGEVWRAEASGGLEKAIKFVYGYLDEDRASRELKALNRIKDVRHPFLLSLERIEIVDGQLLIVTELADGSLKDRFDACQAEGAQGIDRQELLAYMRDASDVLDYMSEQFQLQHLDIKPENLLLVGGRLKVADFGLVKEVHDVTASLMGGLTPLYAPPEVFDGRPSRWSDQYSLAIVFQEMLTGELPFPGKTAAQLARQHLNARPRLSALPDRDRTVIARALSKNPKERYSNCHTLVENLFCGGEAQVPASSSAPRPGNMVTEVTDGKGVKHQTAVLQEVPITRISESTFRVPRVHEVPAVNDLMPLDLSEAQPRLRPTLFLGIGNSGGQVLTRLIRRLNDRFGGLAGIPAMQFLLFDTDAKDLMNAAHADPSETLTQGSAICIPLRRPQEYKEDSRKILQWLSRRWLYNIPRSLKTEGLRPLGRLAFVDNSDVVMDKISEALKTLSDPESIAQSCQATGWQCENEKPRVVLMSSISGGTGGGMFADVAYGVRNVLTELNLPDEDVTGVLMHSTSRRAREKELAIVNSYASLVELNHFSRPGGYYPGDRACNLPSKDAGDNAAFRSTYLIHLGDDLTEQEYDQQVDNVAEYLYLDTATAAGSFFDAARQGAKLPGETDEEIMLHTFGVHQLSCFQDDLVNWACERLCHGVAELWLTGSVTLSTRSVPLSERESTVSVSPLMPKRQMIEMAESAGDEHQLDSARMISQLFDLVEQEFESKPDRFFEKEIQQLLESEDVVTHPDQDQAWVAMSVLMLDRLLGCWQDGDSSDEPGALENVSAPKRRRLVLNTTGKIREWIFSLVDLSDLRAKGAQSVIKAMCDRMDRVAEETAALQGKIRGQLGFAHAQLVNMVSADAKTRKTARKGQPALGEMIKQYCRLRLYNFVLSGASKVTQAYKGQLGSISEELHDFGRDVKHLASQFSVHDMRDYDLEAEARSQFDELCSAVNGVLDQQLGELVQQLDHVVYESLLNRKGGLVKILTDGGAARQRLERALRRSARSVLTAVMKGLDVADMLFHADGEADNTAMSLGESLEGARPPLLACGGAKRLLVMLPAGSTDARPLEILHREFHETPSVVGNNDGDFVLCYEVEQISLTQAAVHLIDARRDFAQFAHRLFTRSDVSWTSLPDLVDD